MNATHASHIEEPAEALLDLAQIGAAMRHAQREYFRTRTPAALDKSKTLETRFDEALAEILNPSPQRKLF